MYSAAGIVRRVSGFVALAWAVEMPADRRVDGQDVIESSVEELVGTLVDSLIYRAAATTAPLRVAKLERTTLAKPEAELEIPGAEDVNVTDALAKPEAELDIPCAEDVNAADAEDMNATVAEDENATGATTTGSRKRARVSNQTTVVRDPYPKRERKEVSRYIASYDAPEVKTVTVPNGKGTPLGEIPNVNFQLSKMSRNDDILIILHRVIFRSAGKATETKKHLSAFNGFNHSGEEEVAQSKYSLDKLLRLPLPQIHEIMGLLDLERGVTKDESSKDAKVGRIYAFLQNPAAREGAKDLQEAAENAAQAKRTQAQTAKGSGEKRKRPEGVSRHRRRRETAPEVTAAEEPDMKPQEKGKTDKKAKEDIKGKKGKTDEKVKKEGKRGTEKENNAKAKKEDSKKAKPAKASQTKTSNKKKESGETKKKADGLSPHRRRRTPEPEATAAEETEAKAEELAEATETTVEPQAEAES